MGKRVLLIGGNFSPEPTGIGKYNGEMITWLADNGYDCTVITTYPYYPEWKVQAPYDKARNWFKKEVAGNITIYRCPQYVPAVPSGKKRMLQDASFAASAFIKVMQLVWRRKFDMVITVAPPFHLGLLAVLYKKMRGATFVYHVQDLQIEAARDLKMIRSGRLINMMLKLEQLILRNADHVSSIADGMIRKIRDKTGRQVFLFPNWVDVSQFHPITDKAVLKEAFGFSATDKIVLYSGAIGEKQGLEALLHAAAAWQHQPDIRFLICGSGPYKVRLEQMAAQLQLKNTTFLPLQPVEQFNRFLNMADVHLVIQKSHASDLVMPSKLTTILAVGGIALITANNGTGLHELVSRHNMGILVDAENQEALQTGIGRAVWDNTADIAENARAYAASYLSISGVMTHFEEQIA
ncbi:WcaI family glycosyltransferase [Chitinophaga polysaccharea]|uniref:WcaI family glycosyltransferase n=1 Tax=Chitinophaga TaxID=79328 RepID=UPI00145504C5|nr:MULTISPECIES: WcaI family glycosyltransferase [Chitinophaga]NLR60539.1 WcaI family glycosyltransferase [Chitinophaga polysaccharea]NLU90508.1 WcaI family glycosyltransferase [Chitinophaga sp. Ak27]